jgi:hypothetical protein
MRNDGIICDGVLTGIEGWDRIERSCAHDTPIHLVGYAFRCTTFCQKATAHQSREAPPELSLRSRLPLTALARRGRSTSLEAPSYLLGGGSVGQPFLVASWKCFRKTHARANAAGETVWSPALVAGLSFVT